MPSKIFPGKFSSLEKISDFVTKHADASGLDENATYAVQLAVDEACSNIIEHAYGGEGQGDIECACNILDDGLEIILRDTGKPFNPKDVQQIKIGVPIEELGSRGAGIYLIKKLMDEVIFEFSKNEGTTLKLKKKK
ncbi:MAG: histidine kinase [Aliifodinibius sp.]|nr:histidine kinase [Fodinibius sp.]